MSLILKEKIAQQAKIIAQVVFATFLIILFLMVYMTVNNVRQEKHLADNEKIT